MLSTKPSLIQHVLYSLRKKNGQLLFAKEDKS